MKKIWVLAVCLMLVLLTACQPAGNTPASTASVPPADSTGSAGQPGEDTFTYSLQGQTVAMNGEMAPLAAALGDPTDYFESESCAYQGLDKVYTYGSVVIRTYPKDGVDYVLSVELKDDTVSTREGVSIGDSKEKVSSVYGDPTASTDLSASYTKGDCTLAFMWDGDTVGAITYTAVVPN